MERIPEPELMDDPAQARAYAEADFAEPHNNCIELFRKHCGSPPAGARVLDLGCGPADITVRFARAFPDCSIDGIDGAPAMLAEGERRLAREGLAERIRLVAGRLPDCAAPEPSYDVIISNSLLHHLPDPAILWQAVRRWGRAGTAVFVMDLLRPPDRETARALVERYAAGEPEILRRDFYHSLLAAWRPLEVEEQLAAAGLADLTVTVVSDRHLVVSGRL